MCVFFAVAEISEGIILRENGLKGDILVLGETCESRISQLVRYKLQQTVISADYAKVLHENGKKISVHIKIDTGMSRLGELRKRRVKVEKEERDLSGHPLHALLSCVMLYHTH